DRIQVRLAINLDIEISDHQGHRRNAGQDVYDTSSRRQREKGDHRSEPASRKQQRFRYRSTPTNKQCDHCREKEAPRKALRKNDLGVDVRLVAAVTMSTYCVRKKPQR